MNWWQRLLRRPEMEEKLDKELQFHLDQHTNDLIARGVSPSEARGHQGPRMRPARPPRERAPRVTS